ncbi:MAG: DUF1998 domain-containing protein, partial [Chloroflexi bacterium]|nr:DUF1998 domain-containing protein [Chloroflexota bacterium]
LKDLAESEGVLRYTGKRWYWMSNHYPAQEVSLRTATQDNFSVVQKASGEVVGQVDAASAPMLIHPGAVYLHESLPYLVEELDWEKRIAYVRATQAEYFTTAELSMKVELLRVLESSAKGTALRAHGEVRVRTRATSFQQIAWYTHEKLATLPLDLPEQELLTTAYWLSLSDKVVTAMRDLGDWTIAPILSYGPNWATQRQRARKRDGYRCRHCGLLEAPGHEHDVHHIRPFRTFDYRPGQNENYLAANDLSNLITLCPECHHRLETARAMQGTLDGLANLLRALAPLYLMCEPRDVGVTADLDFPFTHAPTVVMYDAVPGGVGFRTALDRLTDDLLRACHERVNLCPCDEGCPACVGAPVEVGMGAKARVRQLLKLMLCR